VTNISIGQIQVAESTAGWYAVDAQGNAGEPGPSINPAIDSYTLTSDANIIHVRVSMRYRITDPIAYLFDYVDAGTSVTNALNNSILYASTRFTVDDALIGKLESFRGTVRSRIEELIREQKLGIQIEQVDVKTIPPRQLAKAFNAAIQASVDQQNTNTQAESYMSTNMNRARAQAEAITNAAAAEYIALVKQAHTEETNFLSNLPRYKENPALFADIRQAQTLRRVFSNAQERVFLPARADGKTRELRLLLNREPRGQTNSSASTR
jgi:membrane protease subunit HflK